MSRFERWFHLIGLKQANSNFFKVQIEPLHKFDWHNVPSDVFKQYHELRLEIAEFAVAHMGAAYGDEVELEKDMIPMSEMWKDTPVSLTTLNDMIKRGFIEHEKINGKIYVKRTKWEEFKDYERSHPKSYGKKRLT